MRLVTSILCILLSSQGLFAQGEDATFLKAVNDYLDGGTNGNVEQFKRAFLTDAVQRSIGKNGDVIGMTVESLASKLKAGQTMDRQTRIVSWSYSGIAGTAVTETIYPTSKIIDYLNLLKIEDDWKIVTRVYSRIESDENVISSVPVTGSSAPSAATKSKAAAPQPSKGKVVISDSW